MAGIRFNKRRQIATPLLVGESPYLPFIIRCLQFDERRARVLEQVLCPQGSIEQALREILEPLFLLVAPPLLNKFGPAANWINKPGGQPVV